jgi:hypothetical protein
MLVVALAALGSAGWVFLVKRSQEYSRRAEMYASWGLIYEDNAKVVEGIQKTHRQEVAKRSGKRWRQLCCLPPRRTLPLAWPAAL